MSALPQGGPAPSRTTIRSWQITRGHRPIDTYVELAVVCEDAGFGLSLHLPNAGPGGKQRPGDETVQLTVFIVDRGYVFSQSAASVRSLDSLAIDALATLRAKGLMA